MYNGIEIEHPVFRVLFCNLLLTFFSSTVNVIAYSFTIQIRYSTIVNASNTLCLLFHCCCWLIVSLLRFFYIIHKDWLFSRFPDPKILNRLAVASIFIIYLICFLIILIVAILCGWPRTKMVEMPMPQKAISSGSLIGIYILLICLSCPFYLLILRKRGKLRNNKVGVTIPEVKVKDSNLEVMSNQFGDVWIGDSTTNDALHHNEQRLHSITEQVHFFKHLIRTQNV